MNYSFKDPKDSFKDGDIISAGNFTQAIPDTPIMVGIKLTIRGGNFTNVKKDPNWKIEGGNFTQVDRCSHLNPDLLEKQLIPECADNCKHLTNTDEIVVDGKVVDTIRYYEETVVA
jgi:hypothetical protein